MSSSRPPGSSCCCTANDAEYAAHRGLCETEAESSAYVLANLPGVDVDASSISYIAGWSSAEPSRPDGRRDDEPPDTAGEEVNAA